MQRVDLRTGATHVRVAYDDLQLAWDDVRAHWDDAVSDRFAEQFVDPMGPKVKNALDAMERMAILLDAMMKNCSE